MHEVLATVAACHQSGFYHGDIKPANFMLKQPLDPARPLSDLERWVLLARCSTQSEDPVIWLPLGHETEWSLP